MYLVIMSFAKVDILKATLERKVCPYIPRFLSDLNEIRDKSSVYNAVQHSWVV
jgi:hypothetical protein